MSLKIANLVLDELDETGEGNFTRAELLSLVKPPVYDDGRTKQCHADECNINKIMARFDKTGTISHLAKHQGSYADFSDFDFHENLSQLTRGREIFDDLPAEVRKEFGQSPEAFFKYVNDPANLDDLREKLPGLAAPGQQLPRVPSPTADHDAATASADTAASGPSPKPAEPAPAAAAATEAPSES